MGSLGSLYLLFLLLFMFEIFYNEKLKRKLKNRKISYNA